MGSHCNLVDSKYEVCVLCQKEGAIIKLVVVHHANSIFGFFVVPSHICDISTY